jgi:competence protein ComEA
MKFGRRTAVVSAAGILVLTAFLSFKGNSYKDGYVKPDNGNPGVEAGETEKIQVYVTGEVNNPGIVELERGTLLKDAVEACGGFTENAGANINPVYPLEKNVTLIIKAGGEGLECVDGTGDDVVAVNGEKGLIEGRININTAEMEALCMLPGIGEKTAQAIITHRESEGAFEKIEDIMKVSGIKQNKFEDLEEHICVE